MILDKVAEKALKLIIDFATLQNLGESFSEIPIMDWTGSTIELGITAFTVRTVFFSASWISL